jgi:hypothetical protein
LQSLDPDVIAARSSQKQAAKELLRKQNEFAGNFINVDASTGQSSVDILSRAAAKKAAIEALREENNISVTLEESLQPDDASVPSVFVPEHSPVVTVVSASAEPDKVTVSDVKEENPRVMNVVPALSESNEGTVEVSVQEETPALSEPDQESVEMSVTEETPALTIQDSLTTGMKHPVIDIAARAAAKKEAKEVERGDVKSASAISQHDAPSSQNIVLKPVSVVSTPEASGSGLPVAKVIPLSVSPSISSSLSGPVVVAKVSPLAAVAKVQTVPSNEGKNVIASVPQVTTLVGEVKGTTESLIKENDILIPQATTLAGEMKVVTESSSEVKDISADPQFTSPDGNIHHDEIDPVARAEAKKAAKEALRGDKPHAVPLNSESASVVASPVAQVVEVVSVPELPSSIVDLGKVVEKEDPASTVRTSPDGDMHHDEINVAARAAAKNAAKIAAAQAENKVPTDSQVASTSTISEHIQNQIEASPSVEENEHDVDPVARAAAKRAAKEVARDENSVVTAPTTDSFPTTTQQHEGSAVLQLFGLSGTSELTPLITVQEPHNQIEAVNTQSVSANTTPVIANQKGTEQVQWQTYYDQDGTPYYYNPVTRVSQWESPSP